MSKGFLKLQCMNSRCGIHTRIYITHCSAKKEPSLENTSRQVTPDVLYTARILRGFIKKCKETGVQWAIFSDKYGVWFPNEKHEWYEKDPDTVTEEEFRQLLKNFQERLSDYDEIHFYYNPGRFHPLYKRLTKNAIIKGKLTLFSHKDEIK